MLEEHQMGEGLDNSGDRTDFYLREGLDNNKNVVADLAIVSGNMTCTVCELTTQQIKRIEEFLKDVRERIEIKNGGHIPFRQR